MLLNQQPSPLSTPYPFTVETTTHWDDIWLCLWSRAGRHDSPFLSWGWSRQRDINSLPPGLLKTMSSPCYKDLTGICYQSHQFLTAGATGLPPTLQCNPRIQTQSCHEHSRELSVSSVWLRALRAQLWWRHCCSSRTKSQRDRVPPGTGRVPVSKCCPGLQNLELALFLPVFQGTLHLEFHWVQTPLP